MPMLRNTPLRSTLIAPVLMVLCLLFPSLLYAEIVVNTTQDVDIESIKDPNLTQPHCSWRSPSGDICCGGGETIWISDGLCTLREAYELTRLIKRGGKIGYDFDEDYAVCPTDPRRRPSSRHYDDSIRKNFTPYIPLISDCYEEDAVAVFTGVIDIPHTDDGSPYLLDSELHISSGITLRGDHFYQKAKISLNPDAGVQDRLFLVGASSVFRLENLEIYGGGGESAILGSGNGGLVYVDGGSLVLENVSLHSGTAAGDGGLVYLNQDSKITGTLLEFIEGSAGSDGGAIYARSRTRLTMEEALVQDNAAQNGRAGAIFVEGSDIKATFDKVLFEGNRADDHGTLWAEGGNVRMSAQNATFYNNRAYRGAGAIYWGGRGSSVLDLANVTITGNNGTVGGIEFNQGFNIYNSIIVDNRNGDCLPGTSEDINAQYSLFAIDSPASCEPLVSDESQIKLMQLGSNLLGGSNSVLFDIRRNGGFTRSFLPNPDAPDEISVFNAGSTQTSEVSCQGEDQRGLTRLNTVCDIGAVEFQQARGVDDDITVPFGSNVIIDVAANDIGDTEMDCTEPLLDSVLASGNSCIGILIPPERGAVTETTNERGDVVLQYRPFGGFHGADTFAYEFKAIHAVNGLPVQALATVRYEPVAVSVSEGGVDSGIKARTTEFSDVGASGWIVIIMLLTGGRSAWHRSRYRGAGRKW